MRRVKIGCAVLSVCATSYLSGDVAAQDRRGADPLIQRVMAAVSETRLADLIARLQSFQTRNTLSDAAPDRGIAAARKWIFDELGRSSSRLQVSFDTYRIPPQGRRIAKEVEIRNVMAVLPGRSSRRLYVTAHYDSVALPPSTSKLDEEDRPPPDPKTPSFDRDAAERIAPGANDDGSGTALTMELARVFGESQLEFDATIVFVVFAGEEQGLVGALLHAQRARTENLPIEAVLNNDIVGNVRGGNGLLDSESVRVFSEGPEDSPSRQLARYVHRQAARYLPSHRVRLIARHDRFGRGGDHTAFNQHGFAGVRITESNEDYSRQHSELDTKEGVLPAYLAQNVRVNAAALAAMALAPPAVDLLDKWKRPRLARSPGRYDARLRWTPSPGAASYRVFWREAWAPDWQQEIDVGDVSEFVLPNVSIDDYVFGVAAVGPAGHESVVAAYVYQPRPDEEIRVKP